MAKTKRVKKNAYEHSILVGDLEHCYFCGRDPVQFHHIFSGPYRDTATDDDMFVPLCWECHAKLHSEPSQRMRYMLAEEAQAKWEMSYIGLHSDGTIQGHVEAAHRARDEFRKRYGKSYL